MEQFLEIGQIVNTFGIKGMIKVKAFTDDIQRFSELKEVLIDEKEYKIQEVKYHKNMVLLQLEGITKIEEAEKLKNEYLKIKRENAIPLEEDTYFVVDLIGLNVYSDENEYLGELIDIFNTGSNDIYVVRREEKPQLLLPAIKDVIKQIDIENKKIIVHLIKGLE